MGQENQAYREVMDQIAGLTRGNESIEFESHYPYEVMILLSGGVEVRDFEKAINDWYKAKNFGSDFYFIRSIALREAAKRKLIQSEVL